MVGAFTKFSFSRPSSRARHFHHHHHHLEDRIGGGNRISPAAILHGVPPVETFEAVEHPSEPVDVDQPARCPPPERGITQDGLKWKEMVARRRGPGDSGMPRRRVPNSPREKYLFMIPSIPEQHQQLQQQQQQHQLQQHQQRVVTRLLEG